MTTVVRDDVRAKFMNAFSMAFAPAYPAVPIEVENQKFTQPDTAWVSIYLRWSSSNRASIGTVIKFKRHYGFFGIDIFVPELSGTKALYTMAQTVEQAFDELIFTFPDNSSLHTFVPKVTVHGLEDGFYCATVMVPFYLNTLD